MSYVETTTWEHVNPGDLVRYAGESFGLVISVQRHLYTEIRYRCIWMDSNLHDRMISTGLTSCRQELLRWVP